MSYSISKLTAHCAESLQCLGVSRDDAEAVAQVLISADMRGIHSHGCVRLTGYAACLQSGGIAAGAQYRLLSEGRAFALMDAGRGLGIPATLHAAALAVKKARDAGVAVVNVRNSHHHGACGYYALQCANAGMVGLCMSTGDPIMAATGSASRAIGNNPFSYAAPAGRYRAICYDIAMSAVAAGKISMAADEGREIPPGWLLDPLGRPTTDPQQYALGGALVPFGGYKGYGLSMMVEVLAGILSGAALLEEIHAWNEDPRAGGNVGHCIIAIDPRQLNPGFDVSARAEEMIERLKAMPKAPDVDAIRFPGELEQLREADALANGLTLPPATEQALRRLAEQTGIAFTPEALAQ